MFLWTLRNGSQVFPGAFHDLFYLQTKHLEHRVQNGILKRFIFLDLTRSTLVPETPWVVNTAGFA